MKSYIIIIIVVVAGTLLVLNNLYTSTSFNQESHTIPASIAESSNEFAVNFYKEISDGGDNVFFSPVGMYTAFSMLYEGARGDTASQLQDVFGFGQDNDIRHSATASMVSAINQNDPHATLDIANALWLANWFEISKSYLDVVRNTYLADAKTVDFARDSDIDKINRWASDNTNGKIDKVIQYGDVDRSTAMVINNAIYFKGTWLTQFPIKDTIKGKFYKSSTDTVEVDFMSIKEEFDYADYDDVRILRIPYKGDRLSMLLILPTMGEIRQLEESLSVKHIKQWHDSMQSQTILVQIPKFEIKVDYSLHHILPDMGITYAFDRSTADLSGIPNDVSFGLFVDKATQDAYIKIDEKGTEAAAVTSIYGLQSGPPKFTADHPFLFTIYDEQSGTILFMGRVSDPTS